MVFTILSLSNHEDRRKQESLEDFCTRYCIKKVLNGELNKDIETFLLELLCYYTDIKPKLNLENYALSLNEKFRRNDKTELEIKEVVEKITTNNKDQDISDLLTDNLNIVNNCKAIDIELKDVEEAVTDVKEEEITSQNLKEEYLNLSI